MTNAAQIDRLVAQISTARHAFRPEEQQIALTLLRLLAEGAPVPIKSLAGANELPAGHIEETIHRWPEARRDNRGHLTAFMGLSVAEIGHHRLHLDGRTLSAWCAWDTLFLPELLGTTARVTSRCPTTGEHVSLTMTPDGPSDVAPPITVMSFLTPGRKFGSNVINNFCRYVHFFAPPRPPRAGSKDMRARSSSHSTMATGSRS
jgi:alkylmercury lyase